MAEDFALRTTEPRQAAPTFRAFFKTTAGPDSTEYPSEDDNPNVYYAQMQKLPSFTKEVGRQTLSTTSTTRYRYIFNLVDGDYIEENTVVLCFLENGQWFTIDKVPPDQFVHLRAYDSEQLHLWSKGYTTEITSTLTQQRNSGGKINALRTDSEGNVIVGGTTHYNDLTGGGYHVHEVKKYTADGGLLWTYEHGEQVNDITIGDSDEIAIVGSYDTNTTDIYNYSRVTVLNSDGTEKWIHDLDPTVSISNGPNNQSIRKQRLLSCNFDSLGRLWVTGYNSNQFTVVRFSVTGEYETAYDKTGAFGYLNNESESATGGFAVTFDDDDNAVTGYPIGNIPSISTPGGVSRFETGFQHLQEYGNNAGVAAFAAPTDCMGFEGQELLFSTSDLAIASDGDVFAMGSMLDSSLQTVANLVRLRAVANPDYDATLPITPGGLSSGITNNNTPYTWHIVWQTTVTGMENYASDSGGTWTGIDTTDTVESEGRLPFRVAVDSSDNVAVSHPRTELTTDDWAAVTVYDGSNGEKLYHVDHGDLIDNDNFNWPEVRAVAFGTDDRLFIGGGLSNQPRL